MSQQRRNRNPSQPRMRMGSLQNKTQFRLGWEIQDSHMFENGPGGINGRRIFQQQMDESNYSSFYMSKEEADWRRSQKNIDGSYLLVKADDTVRQRKPTKKLLHFVQEWKKEMQNDYPRFVYIDNPEGMDNGERHQLKVEFPEHQAAFMEQLENEIKRISHQPPTRPFLNTATHCFHFSQPGGNFQCCIRDGLAPEIRFTDSFAPATQNEEFYGLILKWYPQVSTQRAQIYLKNSEDVGYAQQVLEGHNLNAFIPQHFRFQPWNKTIEVHLNSAGYMDNDDIIFENVVRRILYANKIELDRVIFFRKHNEPFPDSVINRKISIMMGKAAVKAGMWRRSAPRTDSEWLQWLADNKSNLPWDLQLPEDNGDTERTATVSFKNENFGVTVIDYLADVTPNPLAFSLTQHDSQGVRCYPIYTLRFVFPNNLRTVFHSDLIHIDQIARGQSDYENNDWCRLRDLPAEKVVLVEGWPREFVESIATSIRIMLLDGVGINCALAPIAVRDPRAPDNKRPNYPELLYGVGLMMVDSLKKKYSDRLTIVVDHLHEKITFYGDGLVRSQVESELRRFLLNKEHYMIEEACIRIAEPRFLPIFRDVLMHNTAKGIGAAVGGPKIRLEPFDKLVFTGSIAQYEDMQQLLDNEHRRMIALAKQWATSPELQSIVIPSAPTCPICCCELSFGNYALENCGHLFCPRCLALSIKLEIDQKRFPIKCFEDGCNQAVSVNDFLNLMSGPINPCLFKGNLMIRLLELGKKNLLTAKNDYLKRCPSPNCNAIIDKKKASSYTLQMCFSCGIEICTKCCDEQHEGLTCEQFAIAKGCDDNGAGMILKSQGGKHCPNCYEGAFKDDGCNHVCCFYCKQHFCFICLFKGPSEPSIYKHMYEEHKSFVDVNNPYYGL